MKLLAASILVLCSTFLFSQVDSSLVAHYTFSGNANDISSNENNGTPDGPTLTTDRFGEADSAYEFDGEDDIIRILDHPSLRLDGDFTFVAWFNPYSVKDHTIFRKNSSANNIPAYPAYGVSLSGTQHYVVSIGTDEGRKGLSTQQAFFNQPYEANNWYRMIVRKQDTTLFLTTNLFEKNTFSNYQISVTGNIPHDSSPFIIGSRTQQQANTFEGKIDDIKIYNRFMTLEEITGLSFDDDEIEDEQEEESMDEMDEDEQQDEDEIDDESGNEDENEMSEEKDEDEDLEEDTIENEISTEIRIITKPWKFLLIEANDTQIDNIKLYKGDELVINQDKASDIISLNLQNLASGTYRLEITDASGTKEHDIEIE